MSSIPKRARQVLKERSAGQCERCGGPANDFHHRLRRRVEWEHQHCACVAYAMCRKCHQWVHEHPTKSREMGWIISFAETEPWNVPVKNFWGWVVQACDGSTRPSAGAS